MNIDRATPATQNGHDKSIRHRPSHGSNLQQAQTFFLLKCDFCVFLGLPHSSPNLATNSKSTPFLWPVRSGTGVALTLRCSCLVSMQHLSRNALAGQKLCLLSLRTANPFPLESFCRHDSGQFRPGKSFLVY